MIQIKAVPNAKKFQITIRENAITIKLKSKAQDGLANRELEKELSKIAGAPASIAAGHKSRSKKIAFDGISDENALEKIKASGQKK